MNLGSWMRCPHREHAQSVRGSREFNRRRFLGTAAGLALGAGLSTPLAAQRGNPHTDASPRPIPGGVSPFGVLIHHFPTPAPGTPIANIFEPSQITDFNGFVGLNRIRGGGSGTGFPSLAFQADMGFMVGEYIAMDGKHYNAALGFIWLDIFNGPVGSANLAQQIHDYNPHISPTGLFWTMLVPRNSVQVHLGAGQASFRLTTSIPDDHDLQSSITQVFPAGFPQPAQITFDVEWSGILDRAHIRNEAQNFEGDFLQTGSTIRWSALNPSSGFQFVSEAPNPARLLYAVIGHERNGVFFT